MICSKCKKEIDNDSRFCEFCGTKIEKTNTADFIEKIMNEQHEEKESSINKLEDVKNTKNLSMTKKLNQKMWYRALKVLYFLIIILGVIISLGIAIWESDLLVFIVFFLVILMVLEILKRSFYYIYFGKLFPNKN